MESIICLGVGNLEIDLRKNWFTSNHSCLFGRHQKRKINYYADDGTVSKRYGYTSKLKDVKLRLNLLGYSLSHVEKLYNKARALVPDYYPSFNLSFKDFSRVVSGVNINKIERIEDPSSYSLGAYAVEMFSQDEFKEFKDYIDITDWDNMTFFENLDPYIFLRLLAENKANQDLALEWRVSDIANISLNNIDDLYECIEDGNKYLIITEGSSDSFVIKRAIEFLRPDISDFFMYVDMEGNYPFSGSGNLYNFLEGLTRIKMLNKCLFVFDNDAEGIEKYNKALKLNSPDNLRVMKLPDLNDFSDFLTVGPNGIEKANVNGKAVAIECFLDLSFKTQNPPRVRWSNYKKTLDCYHGALEEKNFYVKQFKKVKSINDNYCFEKLNVLVEHIVRCCS